MSTNRLIAIILLFILFMIALSGCGGMQPKPEIKIVYVDRPIAINCIKDSPVRPFYATEALPPGATDIEYTDALSDDWKLSRVYEDLLEKSVQACIVPNK